MEYPSPMLRVSSNVSYYSRGRPDCLSLGGEAIEGSDVFLVDGQTRSKFYSSVSRVCLIERGGDNSFRSPR